ncbi:MAG: NADH-quinone oxidoreductase subunit J [Dehalococcoidia bacterium]|nr:NADH-quinone oxidoreductase subunit J [Dehalococcoidia bacterium]
MLELVFLLLAVIAVVSAIGVIALRDLFRAALCLIVLFMMVAGVYVLLHADFLAIVQILIYVGAISVLLIVAIMLTRDVRQGQRLGYLKYIAGVVGLLLLGTIVFAVLNTTFTVTGTAPLEDTIKPLGKALFGDGGYFLTVEIAAILLLSAILGAIAVIREK